MKNKTFVFIALTLIVSITAFSQSAGASGQYFDEDHLEDINGTRLHFRVRGYDKANPYLLILHGGPGASSLEYYPWGERLERQLNVVYFDQRGTGLSERVKFADPESPTIAEAKGFTLADAVRDIEGVRKILGIKKWFVLGHSFGGMVGVEYVTAMSEHVFGYIHMDGLTSMRAINLDWLDYAERSVRKTALTAAREDQTRIDEVLANVAKLRASSAEERNRQVGPMIISKITPERIRDRFPAANDYDARIDAEVLTKYKITPDKLGAPEPWFAFNLNENMASREISPMLGDIQLPVLIISAAGDPIIPAKRLVEMHKALPISRMVVIQDASHEEYKDQPVKTADAVMQFAAGIKLHHD
ncbi:MAG: alpha/beta fold hydrolase [Pyrinomonadaceae bacterium]